MHFFQYTDYDIALFSLDNGKTKFFDLLQMIEFYQLNQVLRNMHWTVSEIFFLS
jgi:hypothetical protein